MRVAARDACHRFLGGTMRTNRFLLITAALFLTALTASLRAQSIQGSILGTVEDATGALVVGAEIAVESEATGFVRNTTSNNRGFYLVDKLLPGQAYTVKVTSAGFKTFVRPGVFLETSAEIRIDAILEIGAITEQVTVTAATPVIETESGRIGTVIDQLQNITMATSARCSYCVLMTSPAAFWTGSGYSMNGSRGGQGNFRIDGVDTGNPVDGNQNSEMWMDIEVVQDLRISSVNNSAEFSELATMNQTTRGGTNEFHGMFNAIYGRGELFARPFFSRSTPEDRLRFVYWNVGGPIKRNKTFFFYHTDYKVSPNLRNGIHNLPTDAMRAGNFAASAFDPIIDPTTGQQFPGNVIPAQRLNPQAQKYLNRFYPLANDGDPLVPSSNGNYDVPGNRIDWAFITRVDHQIADNQTIMYRYFSYISDIQVVESGGLPTFEFYNRQRKNYSHAGSHIWTLSPTVVNEARLGWQRINWPSGSKVFGAEVVADIGLTGYPAPLSTEVSGIPVVSITGLRGISVRSFSPNRMNEWDITDGLSISRGSHTIKTGLNVRHVKFARFPTSPSAQFGSFAFNGEITGEPFADFILGIPRTASRSAAVGQYYGRRDQIGLYFQDDWKIRNDLTLNVGLRYDYVPPFVEEDDRISTFDPATGSLVLPTEQVKGLIHPLFPTQIPVTTATQAGFNERSLIANDTNNIAPRFGLAWRTPWELVIRGGYGIYYNGTARKAFRQMTSGPFAATETFDNDIVNGVPLFAWPQAFPAAGGARPIPIGTTNINAASRNLSDAYVNQWNLTIEKQIGANGLRMSYIANSGIQLPYRRNINTPRASDIPFSQDRRPYPLYRDIFFTESGGTSSYQSLQFQFTRRMTKGFQIDSHYTFAKHLTDTHDSRGTLGDLIEDAYDRRRERGPEEHNPKHRWISNFIWELPFGTGRAYLTGAPKVVDAVVGGWMFSGLVSMANGGMYTPYFTGADVANTNLTKSRPDRICDGNLPSSQRTIERWFDTACFVRPPAGIGRFGNSGNNIIAAPNMTIVNVRMFKFFNITERVKFRYEMLFDNLFNHPNFGFNSRERDPAMNIVSASTGKINRTSASQIGAQSSQRKIWFGLRVEF
jgi:hypothetical protein